MVESPVKNVEPPVTNDEHSEHERLGGCRRRKDPRSWTATPAVQFPGMTADKLSRERCLFLKALLLLVLSRAPRRPEAALSSPSFTLAGRHWRPIPSFVMPLHSCVHSPSSIISSRLFSYLSIHPYCIRACILLPSLALCVQDSLLCIALVSNN